MGAMIKVRGFLVLALLDLFLCNVDATVPVLESYSLPAGLQSVDGSDPFGGCPQTPRNCTAMSPGFCVCPSDDPATGVLIDGEVPTFDPVSDTDWSSGLFTVNMNGQSTAFINFGFESAFNLRGVELKLFNCPNMNIAAPTINVYGSLGLSSVLIPSPSANIADTLDNQDCTSLITVSIPVQLPTSDRQFYYIEFTFANGSSIEWVRIGEIQFSDETPTQPPTTEMTTTISTTPPSTPEPPTTASDATNNPTTASPDSTTTEQPSTTESSTVALTSPPNTDTPGLPTNLSATSPAATTDTQGREGPSISPFSPTTIALAVLVAVFGLVSLTLIAALAVVCVRYYRRFAQSTATEAEYEDVRETDNRAIELRTNEAYGNTRPPSNGEAAEYEVIPN